jgi:hypothetical protein
MLTYDGSLYHGTDLTERGLGRSNHDFDSSTIANLLCYFGQLEGLLSAYLCIVLKIDNEWRIEAHFLGNNELGMLKVHPYTIRDPLAKDRLVMEIDDFIFCSKYFLIRACFCKYYT